MLIIVFQILDPPTLGRLNDNYLSTLLKRRIYWISGLPPFQSSVDFLPDSVMFRKSIDLKIFSKAVFVLVFRGRQTRIALARMRYQQRLERQFVGNFLTQV